ncbi:hypothetical protein DM01DRAFT_1332133 [Hesseltinella vesiculosa]|uniref:Uncharacterized protein n=1 Tax=Hesseltinella vesiculosa TaxID=101127 RepID=A0A1X2GU44_9FUNG|nr:hypothetical protein DM01DRAFT_1332133 [Hesseltinella vesiculosa]
MFLFKKLKKKQSRDPMLEKNASQMLSGLTTMPSDGSSPTQPQLMGFDSACSSSRAGWMPATHLNDQRRGTLVDTNNITAAAVICRASSDNSLNQSLSSACILTTNEGPVIKRGEDSMDATPTPSIVVQNRQWAPRLKWERPRHPRKHRPTKWLIVASAQETEDEQPADTPVKTAEKLQSPPSPPASPLPCHKRGLCASKTKRPKPSKIARLRPSTSYSALSPPLSPRSSLSPSKIPRRSPPAIYPSRGMDPPPGHTKPMSELIS